MTAFLFIPSTGGTAIGRRLDLANIAGLFAEIEDPAPRHDRNSAARIALLFIILLGAIGDTILFAHPEALTSATLTAPPTPRTISGRVTSL